MNSSSRPATTWFRTWVEEQLRRRYTLTIRGLTTDWRGDLGACLAKLPAELFSMVLHQLFYPYDNIDDDNQRKDIKMGLSRTSLVCHEWCRIQRPKLFKSIWIESTADVRFLLDMLRHPSNDWLATAVTDLVILGSSRESPISTERSCRLLLPKLPSLAVLEYDGDGTPSSRQFGPSLQPFFARHSNIRDLTLNYLLFNSFSVLVHVLGDMVNLEELGVDHWPERIDNSARPPTRMFLSSFPKLRRVWHGDSSHRSGKLGWLLSPLLARRCRAHPKDSTSSNSDAALLVLLGNLLGDNSGKSKVTAMTYIKGNDTILLYNWSALAITTGKLKLWPSASVSGGKWSAIRSIECFTASRKLEGAVFHNNENLDEIDWEEIDRSLAQDATRLEKLVVHSNNGVHQQRLPPRLPKLCALGKFKVEETDSDYWELNHADREYGYPE